MFKELFKKLSHLPIHTIAEKIADDFCNHKIPVVTSDVASGKTMIIPALCAQKLSETDPDRISPIYVLVPKRNLANNAADSLTAILGEEDGAKLIGCLNSSRSDDDSRSHPENRIILTTVGYALSSNIINKENNFILDETHEKSIELSLAKAILHRRIKKGEKLRIATMSATIDSKDELSFWGKNSNLYTTKGNAFPVEVLHHPATTYASAAYNLIEHFGCNGLLIFVSGVSEIEDAKEQLEDFLPEHILERTEIMTIHGRSSGEDRKKASAPSKKDYKILIGTNVLESGISLTWVDGGISSGTGKIMTATGNVHSLVETELPRSRIKQQIGRTHRFKKGHFILMGQKNLESRPEEHAPDIIRLPLTELVMRCAHYGIPLKELEFAKSEKPSTTKINEAIETLEKLGFIKSDIHQNIHLTEDGKNIADIPLSFRGGAAFCEAYHLNMLEEALPLIALLEMDDIRKDRRLPLSELFNRSSDLINAMGNIYNAFRTYYKTPHLIGKKCKELNIATHKFKEYNAILTSLENNLEITSDFSIYRDLCTDPENFSDKEDNLIQIIFRAFSDEIFRTNMFGNPIVEKTIDNQKFFSAERGKTSCVVLEYGSEKTRAITGTMRHIGNGSSSRRPFLILENVTAFSESQLKKLSERFPVAEEIISEQNKKNNDEKKFGDILARKIKTYM